MSTLLHIFLYIILNTDIFQYIKKLLLIYIDIFLIKSMLLNRH